VGTRGRKDIGNDGPVGEPKGQPAVRRDRLL